MKMFALALGGLAAAWVAAPSVAMAAHGTIEQRTRAGWRAAAAQAPATDPVVVIPAPRRGGLDDRVPA